MIACDLARGKSGQHRIRQSLTATGGNPRESATETIPLRNTNARAQQRSSSGVRVKGVR